MRRSERKYAPPDHGSERELAKLIVKTAKRTGRDVDEIEELVAVMLKDGEASIGEVEEQLLALGQPGLERSKVSKGSKKQREPEREPRKYGFFQLSVIFWISFVIILIYAYHTFLAK